MDRTTRKLLIGFGVLLVVTLSFSVLMGGMMAPGFMTSADQAGQGPFGLGMMRGHGWMWGLGMGFGGLVMLAFWGVVVVGVMLLIRSIGGFPADHGPETPLNVLKRRYAAGQLTREQYEQMRKDLE
jgi:putative membrane protein